MQASDAEKADKAYVLSVLRSDGLALQFAPAFWNDKEVVTVAVEQDGHALHWASAALKSDKDVVLAAVHQKWAALTHVHPDLLLDIEIMASG